MEIFSKQVDETSSRTALAKFLLIAAACCLLLSLGTSAYLLFALPKTPASTHTALKTKTLSHPISTPQPSAEQQAKDATSTLAKSYLNALLQGQYSTMWSSLHPDIQATWQG